MKISKLFLAAIISFGLIFAACNNDDDGSSGINPQDTDTNVSVTLSMSLTGSTPKSAKALPSDYNYIGKWAGKDNISKITIFLIDGSSVIAQSFTVGTDYVSESNAGQIILRPLESAAMKTSVGSKKVYVLVNGTTEVITALSKTPVAEFEKAYTEIVFALANSGTSTTVSTSADRLAVRNGTIDETIVMTNVSPGTIVVEPNVTAAETVAVTSPKNRVSVNVERAVARVMVSTQALTYEVKSGSSTVLGAISDIRWVLAQGENSMYIQRKADFSTPSFGWVPTTDADYWATGATGANAKYDYSGLFEDYTAADEFGGTLVATMNDYTTDPFGGVTQELNNKLSGKFILPNTHAYGVQEASGYKKGNTAYVLIRAKFTPSASAFGDGGNYTPEDDFFVGANGKFYTTSANAVDPAKGGLANQTVARYVKGKVLYYAWVNPDNVPLWHNSPVIRNNVYHIHITGFKNLGTNWNPLFPEDPDTTTPLNPDPKPSVPGIVEPTNPIDPTDPLTTPETWMSVDVTVLPWGLHSYSVAPGI